MVETTPENPLGDTVAGVIIILVILFIIAFATGGKD